MNVIGERLKKLREVRGLSQRAFAQQLGVQQPSYSRYETSDDNRFVYPGSDIVIRICKLFDCKAGWLLGLEDDNSAPSTLSIRTGDNSPIAIGNNITQINSPRKKGNRK